jgi:phosphatidylinositol alpha 1,6-mannosyltransferase
MIAAERACRVLYCTDTYPPQVNGVSVVTAISVEGLRARGWDCAVVGPRYPARSFNPFARPLPDARDDANHVEIPSLPFPPYPEIRLAAPAYGRIRELLRRFRPDLVHCETEFLVGRLGQIAAIRAGVPHVTSYHTDFSRYAEAYGAAWLRNAVSGYISRFHRRARRTYTPSEPARRDLLMAGVQDVEVWGRGVDTDTFRPTRRSNVLRTSLGVDARFLFLHVGRLAAEKNVETILAGFAIAQRLLPERAAHLVIAGSGPVEGRLRALASPNVTFLGHLDRQRRLPELYASADAFLFASLTETLGLVILEAMASGLPVIATPAGGVADHLRDGRNGLAYPANDAGALARAMVQLVLTPDLRRRLACGALETAAARSWSAELDRLEESYREVCTAAQNATRSAAEIVRPGRMETSSGSPV